MMDKSAVVRFLFAHMRWKRLYAFEVMAYPTSVTFLRLAARLHLQHQPPHPILILFTSGRANLRMVPWVQIIRWMKLKVKASEIWCSETRELKPLVKCFVSIGTGNPGKKAIEDKMLGFLSGTLVRLATQTEQTEKKFIARWAKHFDEKRFFRFNVDQGLQNVRLAEYHEQGAIEAATYGYLDHQVQEFRVRDCIQNLKLKESMAHPNISSIIHEQSIQRTNGSHSMKGWMLVCEVPKTLNDLRIEGTRG